MANQVELVKRIEQVYQWMLEPLPTAEIIRLGTEKWGIKTRAVEIYKAKAAALVYESVRAELPYKLHDIIRKLEQIYEKAMYQGNAAKTSFGTIVYRADMHLARQCLMDQAKLLGLVVDRIQPVAPENFQKLSVVEIEQYAN